MAAERDRYNRERQEIEAAVLAEAMAEFEHVSDDVPLALVARAGWHPGVIGIVAARIREAAGRPSFVIALDDETGLGKGRSEEHTSELQSLMRIPYAVLCLKKKMKTVCR